MDLQEPVLASLKAGWEKEESISAEEMLALDRGYEVDFKVEDNPFAYRPGELNKVSTSAQKSVCPSQYTCTHRVKYAYTDSSHYPLTFCNCFYCNYDLEYRSLTDDSFKNDSTYVSQYPLKYSTPRQPNLHRRSSSGYSCINDSTNPWQYPSSYSTSQQPALQYHWSTSAQNPTSTQHQPRRGRGKRRNDAYWMDYNSRDDTDLFDGRECLFADRNGNVKTPAMADLDTGLKVPGGLIMSSQYAKELGRYLDISQDFADPCLRSISGHLTPVSGILHDVVFRLKGTSVTFKRDFFICDAIDGLVDIMLGASFIKAQFKLLFERVKECFSTFATWFSTKKEGKEEKAERERRERDQTIKANQREIARLQKEQQVLEAAQRQSQEGAGDRQ